MIGRRLRGFATGRETAARLDLLQPGPQQLQHRGARSVLTLVCQQLLERGRGKGANPMLQIAHTEPVVVRNGEFGGG